MKTIIPSDISIEYQSKGNCYLITPLTDLGKDFMYLWNRKVHRQKTYMGAINEFTEFALNKGLSIENF